MGLNFLFRVDFEVGGLIAEKLVDCCTKLEKDGVLLLFRILSVEGNDIVSK